MFLLLSAGWLHRGRMKPYAFLLFSMKDWRLCAKASGVCSCIASSHFLFASFAAGIGSIADESRTMA